MRRQAHPHFVFAKDGFYDDISRVHRAAREVTYHELEHVTGWRSTTVYHEPGVKRRLERLLGIRIARWDTDPAEENGVFYQGFARGAKAETPPSTPTGPKTTSPSSFTSRPACRPTAAPAFGVTNAPTGARPPRSSAHQRFGGRCEAPGTS